MSIQSYSVVLPAIKNCAPKKYYYKVFGLVVSCWINFSWPLERIQAPVGEVDCEIVQTNDAISLLGWDLFYTSPLLMPITFQPKLQIFSSAQGILLFYPEFGYFEIQPSKIMYYPQNTLNQSRLETLLFRNILIIWLEIIKMPVFHASGVVFRDSAIGFLANSNSGKSTLAAAFLCSGAKFLTDDILPLERKDYRYQALPSYAWLRLRSEAAKALEYKVGENSADPEKVAVRLDEKYGQFFPEPACLAALFLPARRDDAASISIQTLPSKQAYLGLLQHTFVGKWLVRSPLAAQRMGFLARLVKDIPIKQLIYPTGYEHLPAVVEAVKQDLGL